MCCVTDQSSLLGIFHRGVKNKNKKWWAYVDTDKLPGHGTNETEQKIITETNESKNKAKLKKKTKFSDMVHEVNNHVYLWPVARENHLMFSVDRRWDPIRMNWSSHLKQLNGMEKKIVNGSLIIVSLACSLGVLLRRVDVKRLANSTDYVWFGVRVDVGGRGRGKANIQCPTPFPPLLCDRHISTTPSPLLLWYKFISLTQP